MDEARQHLLGDGGLGVGPQLQWFFFSVFPLSSLWGRVSFALGILWSKKCWGIVVAFLLPWYLLQTLVVKRPVWGSSVGSDHRNHMGSSWEACVKGKSWSKFSRVWKESGWTETLSPFNWGGEVSFKVTPLERRRIRMTVRALVLDLLGKGYLHAPGKRGAWSFLLANLMLHPGSATLWETSMEKIYFIWNPSWIQMRRPRGWACPLTRVLGTLLLSSLNRGNTRNTSLDGCKTKIKEQCWGDHIDPQCQQPKHWAIWTS